jgi:hypothetical protein
MREGPAHKKKEGIQQSLPCPSFQPLKQNALRRKEKAKFDKIGMSRGFSYQELLKKTKIDKHANNDKHRHFLPNPDCI